VLKWLLRLSSERSQVQILPGGAGGVRRDTPVLVGSNPASVPSGTDTLSPLIPPYSSSLQEVFDRK